MKTKTTEPAAITYPSEGVAGVDRLLDDHDLERITGLSNRTFRTWRSDGSGRGPAFVKIGKAVRYRASDVQTWISLL